MNKNLILVAAVVLAVPLFGVGIWLTSPKTTGGAASSALSILACGDGYVKLSLVREITISVPASGCWTQTLVRPYSAPAFWIEPSARLFVQRFYADGSKATVDFDPTLEIQDSKKVTGVRFRNPSSDPVAVRIQLQ